jgi:hypothetical protein
MGTLTGCLKKAGAAIHADDKADILERARVLKAEGAQSPAEQAIDEQLAKVRAMIAELGGEADESAPEKVAKPDAKIDDFGEKLLGARKDYAALLKDALDVDIAAEPLSKSWPEPDYQKLLDGGADPFVVAWVHASRDEVPTKPQKSWKLRGWVDSVTLLRDVSQKMLNGEISRDALTAKLASSEFSMLKSAVGGRAELYELVGHDQSLKGITMQEHYYTLYRGQNNVRKWAIEQKAKATAFGNWPREIAVADTKQEVLDAFKAKIASTDLGKKAKGQASQFVIYRKRGHSGAWVGKKIGREYIDLHQSADVVEARKYMQDHVADLEAKLSKYRETPFERKDENQPRVGDDHRNGAPVTPEIFAETFGFRGVQFGNYVEQGRRQSDLNEAFDGLMDMAAVLGIPPRSLSLNGKLGLAFGARGKGGKNAPAAHFERDNVVINLTKGGGPGSLAHEWWHGLDSYFVRENGGGSGYVTDGAKAPAMRDEMLAAFKSVQLATQAASLRRRSAELDKRKSKAYWNTPVELSARSFESYIIAKLQDQNASNDYLANVVDEKVWKIEEDARSAFFGGESVDSYPYPDQAELPAVRAAFDDFFKIVETKDDGAGNVALFSANPSGDQRSATIPRATTDSIVAKIRKAFPRAPDIVVHDFIEDAPKALQDHIDSAGARDDVEAAYHDGKIHVFPQNISSAERMEFVVGRHEIRHAGLDGLLGSRKSAFLRDLYDQNAGLKKAADAKVRDGLASSRDVAVEEALADMPTEAIEALTGWDKAVATIRSALRMLADVLKARGLNALSKAVNPKGWTDKEIAALVKRAEDMSRAGEGRETLFARAWHGTPHRGIEKFSTDKIGTGEGAQAYGWGLYYASKREIAEHYRKGLSYKQIVQEFRDEMPDDADFDEVLDAADEMTPFRARVIRALAADDWLGFDYPSQAINAAFKSIDNYDASPELKDAVQAAQGQLYEVEVPEDSELLHWDKPLSEQPEGIWEAFDDAARSALKPEDIERIEKRKGSMTGEQAYRMIEEARLAGGSGIGTASARAASKLLQEFGIRGIKYLDGTSRDGSGDSHNYVIFSGDDVQIQGTMFSRAPTVSDPKSTAIDVRREKSAWRDSLGRSQFAPGAWAYNKVAPFVNERILTPLKLNAMPPELRTQVRAMKLQIQASKDVAVRVAGEGFKLSEQDRVLVSDIIEGELAAGTIPPEHAMRMAAGINTIMDQQTNDLVELGMLAKDSAERWRGAYLPRFYKSKLMQTLREGGADLWGATLRKSARKPAVMQGIKGDSLKGRGLWETVPASELASWEAMGWEVRDPDYEAGVSPDVQMWRDYSREERDKMGEIRDAGFRFTMGYLRTQRDIAMGRMFAGIAEDKSLSAKEGRQPANWVQVPDGSIPGTGGVKRYGKLAGMYVAPEVMNHLENHDQGASEALKLYRKALGMWKEGKVVLNPVSHANNMMGNVSMAHFAGVSYWDAHKYAGTINDLVRKSPMVEEARKAGLFLGTMSQEELLTTMPPELRAMAAMQASKAEKSADFVWNVLSMWLRKPAGKLYEAEDLFFRYLIYRDARNQGLSAEDAVDYSQRYIFTYDDLPKGAQQVRDFAVPFFAYTYKAVPALLHTATHYPHRFLAPAGVMWGLNAAMYALAAGDDDEDWTDKILTYINDPERRKKAEQIESGERENLPPWMKGNSSVLGSPKAVRLGLDEVTGLPMFWDIAQIMPGGNLFDVENNSGGIGWPQSIMPSHPLLTATAAMFWNKDTFFGKDIVDADDTTGEASQKRATWLWKQITPAIAIGNYHTERLANVVAQMTGEPVTWFPRDATGVGKDGLPVQPKLAAMQTVGIKVRPIDVDMSQQINEGQRAKMIRDIDAEIRRINRLSQKGAMSDRNADTEIELQQTKKDRLREGLTVDGEQPK